MVIFGYMGEFGPATSLEALRVYGGLAAAKAGGSARFAFSPPDCLEACWGPTIVSDDHATLVIAGAPTHGGKCGSASAHSETAAAILAAYRDNGTAVLATLAGPFALAILERSGRRALLAIDRMGIEGLTYRAGRNGLVFGSSASAVAHSPEAVPRLCPQAIFDYLFHHMIPAPRTAFEGVSKLRAGCYALFERGEVRVERYWKPRFSLDTKVSFAALRSELHQSLRQAVADSAVAPESTGSFLSGGLDSSTVAGMLATVQNGAANTFSIGFGYPDYDELPYARIVNRHFGCKGHEYIIRAEDTQAAFDLIARACDEPFGNSSALPTYYCAKLARDHGISHLLAGDGGDELFAGNSRYAEQKKLELYRPLAALFGRRAFTSMLSPVAVEERLPLLRKVDNYLRPFLSGLPERLENWNFLVRLGIGHVLCADFLAAVDPQSTFRDMRELWLSTPSNDCLHRMLYYDWQYTLADNDLRKVGTMCALAGVSVSYPMLHPSVVDLSTRVPPQIMMPGQKLRHFYKEAMRDFLPEAVIHKKKHGFGLPFGLWLQESAQLRSQIMDNLATLRGRQIFRPEFLERLQRLHGEEDARYYGVFIWVAAMLEQWAAAHRVAL
jgi:asparagine synthase (glutamine-hydrolysing)